LKNLFKTTRVPCWTFHQIEKINWNWRFPPNLKTSWIQTEGFPPNLKDRLEPDWRFSLKPRTGQNWFVLSTVSFHSLQTKCPPIIESTVNGHKQSMAINSAEVHLNSNCLPNAGGCCDFW